MIEAVDCSVDLIVTDQGHYISEANFFDANDDDCGSVSQSNNKNKVDNHRVSLGGTKYHNHQRYNRQMNRTEPRRDT